MENERLIDLEIRLTHQEATLQTLNDVMVNQQRLIDQLSKEIESLRRQLHDMSSGAIATPWEEGPPPHY